MFTVDQWLWKAKSTCSGTYLASIGCWICQSCYDVMRVLCLRKREKLHQTQKIFDFINHIETTEEFNVTAAKIYDFQRPEQ